MWGGLSSHCGCGTAGYGARSLVDVFRPPVSLALPPCHRNTGVGDMVMATVRKGKPELRKKGERREID